MYWQFHAGDTGKRRIIFVQDTSKATGVGLTGLVYNSPGLKWYYWREDAGNAAGTAVTLATATRGAWSTGGFVEIDATNLSGFYEIGIPNAVLASGSAWATMLLTGAINMGPIPIAIALDAPVNVVEINGQPPIVRSGTTQAVSSSSATLDAGASNTTDFYKGMFILLDSGTGAGSVGFCTGYNGTTKVATINGWFGTSIAPSGTPTFTVVTF